MPRWNSKKFLLVLGLALVLAAGGITTASNMGFKFVKNYTNTAAGHNVNTVTLPYIQSQFVKASDLLNDAGDDAVCQITDNGGSSCWTPSSFANFTLSLQPASGGGCYEVLRSTATTEVIVGAHDPTTVLHLTNFAPGHNVNAVNLPYHMTYVKASDVFNDIGPTAAAVCQITNNGGSACWTPSSFGNFNLNIGECYEVLVTASTNWTPDHY